MSKAYKLSIIFIFLLILLLSTSCTMKEGILVTIEDKSRTGPEAPSNAISSVLDVVPQKILIENNIKILQDISSDLIPLAISPDNNTVFAFEIAKNIEVEAENNKIVTGNLKQEILLYSIKVSNKDKKLVGKFMNIKDFQFDNTGKMLAFIDGSNSTYVYDLATEILDVIMKGNRNTSFNQVSWSKDSKSIMLDTKLDIDIASKELISYVVDRPYIKHNLNSNDYYIVQMKNAEYKDMVAIYDFESKDYISLANGIYLDSDSHNIIYTNRDMTVLEIVALKTREDKSIEHAPIYNAFILNSTGEIIYTTLNDDSDDINRYKLVKYNPDTGYKKELIVNSPTFYLSPSEDKLYFLGNYWENNFTVYLSAFTSSNITVKREDYDIEAIKSVIIKMFDLDYNFKDSYERYIEEAKKVYANTHHPMPQEALENKLIDFKRFNAPLPSNQKEATKPRTLIIDGLTINGNRASLNLGLFYINSIELVKLDGSWYITGFSTHPDSKEVADVKAVVQKHLSDIISNNKEEALKYFNIEEATDFTASQVSIIEDFILNNDKYTYEIGEIELWNKSEPHRVEKPEASNCARVKVIIKSPSNTFKYKLTLTKNLKNVFEITSWSADPLSVSQFF